MTPPDRRPRPIEDLLQHRDRVARLARDLVADEARAADVEQETWLVALRSAGRPIDAPRSWLSGVVRNVARNCRRSERRRNVHEARAMGGATPQRAADSLADAELRERVVRAVLELDEPFRATLILRYLEDLPPRSVAARLGVPVETVRSRVRRGLARVRSVLDVRHGGDGSGGSVPLLLAPLVGRRPIAGRATTEGAVMAASTKKTTVLLALLLLISGTAAIWGGFERSTPRLDTGQAAAGADAAMGRGPEGRARRTVAGPGETSVRRHVDAGSAVLTADAGAATVAVPGVRPDEPATAGAPIPDTLVASALRGEIRVVGENGEAVRGARVRLVRRAAIGDPGDYACVLMAMLAPDELLASGVTDADGLTCLEFPDDIARTGLCVSGDRRADAFASEAAATSEVVLGAPHEINGEVRSLDGEPPWEGLDVFLTIGGGPPRVIARATTDARGRFTMPNVGAGSYAAWVAWPDGMPVPAGGLLIPRDIRATLTVRGGGRVRGVVRDEASGTPLPGVRVLALGAAGYVGVATSAVDGRYAIVVIGQGPIRRLMAWKESYAELHHRDTPIAIAAGDDIERDFALYRGGSVVGVVCGPDGPVAGASVWIWVADANRFISHSSATTDAEGRYRIDGVRPGTGMLAATAPGLRHAGVPRRSGGFDAIDWGPLIEGTLDPRCAVRVVANVITSFDVMLESEGSPKKATVDARHVKTLPTPAR